MDGGWGQYAIALPELDAAVTILSDMTDSSYALEAFETYLLPVSYTHLEAANNPGGSAGMGMGMGAGVAMGQMFAQSLQAAQHTAPAQPAAGTQPAAAAFCSQCGQPLAPGAKFCSHCGAQQSAANQCAACGQPLQPGAKFCPNCGAKQ